MSFASGLAAGLRPLPNVLLHNQRRADDQALGESLTGLTNEGYAREMESDPGFVGPPREAVGGDDPSKPRREQVKFTPAQVQQRLAGLYAKHGRPDQAATMLGRGAEAAERSEDRALRRDLGERQFGLQEDSLALRQGAEDRQQATFEQEQEQLAMRELYQALLSQEPGIVNSVARKHGHLLGLGEGRQVVGMDIVQGPDGETMISPLVWNDQTQSAGPMTEMASADGDDQVVAVPLSYIRQRAGIEEPAVGGADSKPSEVQTAEWLMARGVAATPDQAWTMVRWSRSDPNAFVGRYLDSMLKVQAENRIRPGDERYRDQEQIVDDAVKLYRTIRARTQGGDPNPGGGGGLSPRGNDAVLDTILSLNRGNNAGAGQRPHGLAPPPLIASPGAARGLQSPSQSQPAPDGAARNGQSSEAPPAPRNPAERQIGAVYRAHDGRLVRWEGDKWILVSE